MQYLSTLLIIVSLSGCSSIPGVPDSLQGKNLLKTGATTAVTFAVAGPIPAAANLLTSITVDEVVPEPEPEVPVIESGNKEQMWAYIWKELMENILYGVIGLLVFTTVIGPWALQRRARRKRKYDQYKAEAKASREQNMRK